MGEKKQVVYNNLPLHYKVTGTGNPVVLLHGFGEDGHIWQQQVSYLQNNYRLIVPDLPGSGASSVWPGSAGITDYANAIAALIQIETDEPCTVLGHSMGGYIALSLAEIVPSLLNGIGLIHSTAFADSEDKKATRRKAIAFIIDNGPLAFLKTSIPGLFGSHFAAQHPHIIDTLIQQGEAFTPAALVQYYQAMLERPNRSAVLANSKLPVLLLAGREDKAVPFADSLRQCYLAAETHFHILEKSAHMGMLEETVRTNSFLGSFLARLAEKK